MREPTYQVTAEGIVINSEKMHIKLMPYLDHCIRIRCAAGPAIQPHQSLMVQTEPENPPAFSVQENTHQIIFSTAAVTIEINRATLAFTYKDSAGRVLTKEPDRGGKTLEPVNVTVNVFDPSSEVALEHSPDGEKVRARGIQTSFQKPAYHAKVEFAWAKEEGLFGLGSHEEGMFNLRGQHQYLYQQNMKVFIPVLVSTLGYGFLFDQYSSATFHDDAFGSYLWMDLVEAIDFYFIYGPEFDQIIHTIRTLTGASPMLPKWAFGFIQSKERYKTQDELVDVVREYRKRNLPLDCVVLDWQSWPEKQWGQKSLDPQRFADPARMMDEIHNLNAHLMVSIWPNMSPGGADWQEMGRHEFLLGNRSTYNAFHPAARDMYWKQANEGIFRYGTDAWWCDCTEPFEADWRGAGKPEPEERMRINVNEAKMYLDPLMINAYSLLHIQGIYTGQRNTTPEKRVAILTRSAYLGQQRYGSVVWSGDVAASWDTLRKQIADGLNFCVTGMPFWTIDIGAFFVKTRPEYWFWNGDYDLGIEDLGYRELFIRWFQFGAFLPMFRVHGTDAPREVWQFGAPGEMMYEALASTLRLRYRLMPYIYSLAGWTTHFHYTMLRMLPFDFRNDPDTRHVHDQFMFGPALLVNPVTQPMYYAANSMPLEGVEKKRQVYLPGGCGWYDFWSGAYYEGGQTVCADAPMDQMPIFVRSGSILPVGPEIQYADQPTREPIEVRIYPGADCLFQLYLDENDTYNYEQGAYAFVPLRWKEEESRLIIEERQGDFPGMPAKIDFKIVLIGKDRTNKIIRRVEYDGKQTEVRC